MASTTLESGGSRRRRGTMYEMRRNVWAYAFIAPFFLLFAIFGLFPYLYAFYLSFVTWDGIGGPASQQWVGLENYQQLARDDVFRKSLYNSIWLFVVTSLNLVIALLLAFILNSGLVRFKEFYRAAFFAPIVASSVAIAIIFSTLFGERYGALNYVTGLVGIAPVDWLGSAAWIKPAIALVVIWRYFGWNTIIYLAGLQSINTDLYEAARVDGAGWRQIFFRITMPLMRPVITFTVILSIIGALQLFEEPLLLAGGTASTSPGGTDRAGLTVLVYMYSQAFQYLEFGYAAAMSVALFVIIVVFSFLYYRFLGQEEA
ncbi:MAG: sugar ABC transporter permease [Chloroflexia bacterium]|nr:sugar ABC transporter permease [Chloroflexia bacterium]